MSDYLAVDFDALTGETIEREFTAEEIAQFETSVAANQAEQQAKAQARESALAKLAALGLTQEEIGAL